MNEAELYIEAVNPQTSPLNLQELSNHKSELIRAAVASNPNTNQETLLYLVGDPSKIVQDNLKKAKTNFKIESYEFSATKNSKLSIVKINDAEFIISLRENPELNKYLSQVDSDVEKQQEWIANYKKREAERLEFYFIIKDMNNKSLGTVRLYDFQLGSFCWGSWIIKPGSPRKTAIESAINIYEFAFEVLGFCQSHFDVRNKNVNVINFHLRMGAQIVKSNEVDTYFIMTKAAYTKSKQDLKQFLL